MSEFVMFFTKMVLHPSFSNSISYGIKKYGIEVTLHDLPTEYKNLPTG